jgi:hypothetical protein
VPLLARILTRTGTATGKPVCEPRELVPNANGASPREGLQADQESAIKRPEARPFGAQRFDKGG